MRNAMFPWMCICSLAAPAAAGEHEFERTFDAAAVRHVTVGLASAEITVKGTKGKTIRIEADADPRVKVDGKTVTVGSFDTMKPPRTPELVREWKGEATELELHVPEGVDLTVRTMAGDVHIGRLKGRLEVMVVSGDVRVDECSGRMDVQSVSGDVVIRDATADLSGQSVSGDVLVRGFDALTLEAQSVSGSVIVERAKARIVRLSSHSGDVEYAGETAADGSVDLTTFSGSAIIRIPDGSGFEVDATTFSGSVSLDRDAEVSERSEHRLRARTSKPGPRVRLKSHSGDVEVK